LLVATSRTRLQKIGSELSGQLRFLKANIDVYALVLGQAQLLHQRQTECEVRCRLRDGIETAADC